MREVDHRAKNALAVAQAIVQLTQASDIDAFRRAVQGRIASLARVHTLLADERWTGADLRRLVEEELEPYIAERPSRATIEGPTYALPPAVAQTIGLVLHELTTNAAKHGALSQPDGDVSVSWRVEASSDLTIVWRETSSLPVSIVSRRGFGFTMLEQSIEKQLGGKWLINRLEDGFTCTITLPHSGVRQEAASAQAAANGKSTALIVEDEPLIAFALEEELTGLGISVAAIAGRLQEAEGLLSTHHFDLALLDLNLAGDSTVGIARSLVGAGTKVIFCTGYQSAQLPPDLATLPVLTKPIQTDDLRGALEALQVPRPSA
jgi:two-component sensor histidine kinase